MPIVKISVDATRDQVPVRLFMTVAFRVRFRDQ
jgi:hypothetical protein